MLSALYLVPNETVYITARRMLRFLDYDNKWISLINNNSA